MGGTLRWADSGMAVSVSDRTLVTVLREPMTLPRLVQMGGASRDLAALYPHEIVSVFVLEPSAHGSVPADVRGEAGALMKSLPLLCAPIVVEGRGFGAAAIRALIAGLALVSRPRYRQKVFDTTDHAADWAAQLMAEGAAARELVKRDMLALVEETRASITSPGDSAEQSRG
jgi:hypothetical protein